MATKVITKIKINDKAILKKLDQLLDAVTMLELHNLLAKTVNPWVPMLEGPLSQNLEITSEGVTYLQPYSRYQYYGIDFNHTKDYHPLASAMWDKAALEVKGDEFSEQVTAILKRRAKELG